MCMYNAWLDFQNLFPAFFAVSFLCKFYMYISGMCDIRTFLHGVNKLTAINETQLFIAYFSAL